MTRPSLVTPPASRGADDLRRPFPDDFRRGAERRHATFDDCSAAALLPSPQRDSGAGRFHVSRPIADDRADDLTFQARAPFRCRGIASGQRAAIAIGRGASCRGLLRSRRRGLPHGWAMSCLVELMVAKGDGSSIGHFAGSLSIDDFAFQLLLYRVAPICRAFCRSAPDDHRRRLAMPDGLAARRCSMTPRWRRITISPAAWLPHAPTTGPRLRSAGLHGRAARATPPRGDQHFGYARMPLYGLVTLKRRFRTRA